MLCGVDAESERGVQVRDCEGQCSAGLLQAQGGDEQHVQIHAQIQPQLRPAGHRGRPKGVSLTHLSQLLSHTSFSCLNSSQM